ncbi:hypothetical protein PENARI_c006G02902 [Penicillium arizonense]|uniref:Uncharacterized protein n=1 Tax=Penicillium arizonense TaxID=1835702 RepID=A0A1F5LMK9_PENAI|nr:hypothetical protein PENARI_c006G02902 [Penicillium arizonense]OGE54443.1 hypothetical protein PENARI_c006G02902 [Penicillium arizonense]
MPANFGIPAAFSRAERHSVAAPAKSKTTPEENKRQHGENILRCLEPNSGASFARNATPALSIFKIISPEEIKNLAKVYFNKVAPCYGLVNRQVFFQRLEERSQSTLSNDRYDSVFAGVAALGSLLQFLNGL